MTIEFTKRIAAELLKRGESKVRINTLALEKASKAMTREDVKRLIQDGSVYALKEKHNLSLSSKKLKLRRAKGRSRGQGRRKGSDKARQGRTWEKKVRSQRLFLKQLKLTGKIDKAAFRKYYMLIKGNSFTDKASLLRRLEEEGTKVSPEEVTAMNDTIGKMYK
jgi:large subunit ribosomal protein L19e